MKKLLFLLCLLFHGLLFAQNYKNPPVENAIVFENNIKGKKAEDNFKIINKSDESKFNVEIYYFFDNSWNLAGSCIFAKKDSNCSIDNKTGKDLDKYSHFAIAIPYSKDFNYDLDVKHDDLYITITNVTFDENGKEKLTKENEAINDFSRYQKVIQINGKSKEQIYEGILQAAVKIFNKSTYVIEYKDKESGIISGKASFVENNGFWVSKYNFNFTFEARDGRYRATFDNFENLKGTANVKYEIDEDVYNENFVSNFSNIINTINSTLNSQSSNDDW